MDKAGTDKEMGNFTLPLDKSRFMWYTLKEFLIKESATFLKRYGF